MKKEDWELVILVLLVLGIVALLQVDVQDDQEKAILKVVNKEVP